MELSFVGGIKWAFEFVFTADKTEVSVGFSGFDAEVSIHFDQLVMIEIYACQ
jgi:hypothetical protein